MGVNARGCQNGASMSSADCQWLHGGQQVDNRAYLGGNIGCVTCVPAVAVIVLGGPAFGIIREVVDVARGGILVEVTKLSPVYNVLTVLFILSSLSLHTLS